MEKNIVKNIRDIATQKRIHEHLANPNDVISDEDIMNAKTDRFGYDDATAVNAPSGMQAHLHQNSDTAEDTTNDPGIGTSWNILEP